MPKVFMQAPYILAGEEELREAGLLGDSSVVTYVSLVEGVSGLTVPHYVIHYSNGATNSVSTHVVHKHHFDKTLAKIGNREK